MEGEGASWMWEQQKEGQEKGCQADSAGGTSSSRSSRSGRADTELLRTAMLGSRGQPKAGDNLKQRTGYAQTRLKITGSGR